MKKDEPEFVYARKPNDNIRGNLTGGSYHCRLESCRGQRLAVRWETRAEDYPAPMINFPRYVITYPCTAGMHIRQDGDWQIE